MEERTKIFYKKLGANLKKEREKKGYTLKVVAEKMGRGVSTVSDNERGITEIPFSVIVEYCNLYGVSVDDITPTY